MKNHQQITHPTQHSYYYSQNTAFREQFGDDIGYYFFGVILTPPKNDSYTLCSSKASTRAPNYDKHLPNSPSIVAEESPDFSVLNKKSSINASHTSLSYCAFHRDGSLKLQEQIPNASVEQRQYIIEDLSKELPSLSCNQYGNYVVQRLIRYAIPKQQMQIIDILKSKLEILATNVYGHRVVVEALEFSDGNGKLLILRALLGSFNKIINHEQGNYVAQKCIKSVGKYYQCDDIWEKFYGCVWKIATNKFGHCVLKTLLIYAPVDVKEGIIKEIVEDIILLSKNPFGNYIVQQIFDKEVKCPNAVKDEAISMIFNNFDNLSCNKFASNVVEKCLEESTADQLEVVTEKILLSSNKKLTKLINNEFGNYVVKTLMKFIDNNEKKKIRCRVQKILPRVRCSPAIQYLFSDGDQPQYLFCSIPTTGSRSSVASESPSQLSFPITD